MKKASESSRTLSFLLFPICAVSCPHCSEVLIETCEDLNSSTQCPGCSRPFIYIDGFLNHYRRHTGIFIDPVHAIPIAPGNTVAGEIQVVPDEIHVISYGVIYDRPPELFFFDQQGRPVRDLILDNLYVAAVSISPESFILMSRTFDRELDIPEHRIRWMSIGEIGEHEKPLWINILQNAADLILNSEERAALVMLQISLDFFIDAILQQLELNYRDVKAASRRWKISDRRTKIRLLEERFGIIPRKLTSKLKDLAEQRNRVVHGKVSRPEARSFSCSQAFEVTLEAIITINDMKYAYFRRGERKGNNRR